MDRDALLRQVEFRPEQLKEALQQAKEEVEKLERQKDDLEEAIGVLSLLLRVREGEVQAPLKAAKAETRIEGSSNHPFQGMKLADAAATVLQENGGRLHGLRILDGIQTGGISAKMGTLAVAMRRDDRFEKVRRVKNTWRLRSASV